MSKMQELQAAMDRYSAASVRNLEITREIGNKIIVGFANYLGDPNVFGVPPDHDWDAPVRDYEDEKFSYFKWDIILLEPIRMGLAVNIPQTRGSSHFSMRVVLAFNIEGQHFSVTIGDGKTISGLDVDLSNEQPLYDAIHSYFLEILDSPARAFEARQSGAIGFLAKA